MSELRIILDKSVVYGLNNSEIDSLDRYFFLIVPPILKNEILADLSKEPEEPTITNRIAGHSYRISGNRGLTPDYQTILINSLMGNEIPMEGKYLPAGERMVRSADGTTGAKVETIFDDETIARWERKSFTEAEKTWAKPWRIKSERPINPKLYTDKIAEAGLEFKIPNDDRTLVETVDSLLNERSLQGKLFPLIYREHNIPKEIQSQTIDRWFKQGRPMFNDFAPYAFFCIRANFLWALGLTNPQLFRPDKNDRKDLEYCYYLPHCEMFTSKDKKHKRLVPALLRSNQSFVDGEQLKTDLRTLFQWWEGLSQEEKPQVKAERGSAPPEHESSIIFQLWKKHRNKISKPIPMELLKAKVVDSSKPKEERVEMTFEELLLSLAEKAEKAENLSPKEIDKVNKASGETNPVNFIQRTTKLSKDRALKLFPPLRKPEMD